jgi:hypothetical protein
MAIVDLARGRSRWRWAAAERPAPAGLAQQWRENGRTEHASAAAFAQLAVDSRVDGALNEGLGAHHREAGPPPGGARVCAMLGQARAG